MTTKSTAFVHQTKDEEGLAPSCVVALANVLDRTGVFLQRTPLGFRAVYDGSRTDPYALLSELLEDIAGGRH